MKEINKINENFGIKNIFLKKATEKIVNYRPVLLACADYKTLTKIIAEMFK